MVFTCLQFTLPSVLSVKAAVDFHVAEYNVGSREVGNTSFFI